MSNPDVFISYARVDEKTAEKLQDELESRGLNVWRDKTGIRRNEDFAVEIVDAIFHSAALVVLWSPASKDSPWVQDEALLGYSLNRLIGPFVEPDVHKVLPPPYKTIDSQTFNLSLPASALKTVLGNIVTDVTEARTRTPLYMRDRPPARKSRDEDLDLFTHSVLNAKFCFEAYAGDAERSIHTRFLAAITELRGWADKTVREAVGRFGDGNSPGEAIWALYAAAEAINSKPLWLAVGRAVRPFSVVMSVACLKRGELTSESIKSEFYPTPVDKLLKRRRKSAPRPTKSKPALSPSQPTQLARAQISPTAAPQPSARPTTEPQTTAAAEAGAFARKRVNPPLASPAQMLQPVPPNPETSDSVDLSAAPSDGTISETDEARSEPRTRLLVLAILLIALIIIGGLLLFGQNKQPPNDLVSEGPTDDFGPEPPKPEPQLKTYTVQSEESCWAIALRLTGDGRRCADLQPLNPTLNLQGWDSIIHPGDTLAIPSDGPWASRPNPAE